MAAETTSREAIVLAEKFEQDFINAALAKVRTPKYRYLLTLGFDALAEIFASVENEPSRPAAKQLKSGSKRSRQRQSQG